LKKVNTNNKKRCSHEGCTTYAQYKGGVCFRHSTTKGIDPNNRLTVEDHKRKRAEKKQVSSKKRREAAKELVRNRQLTLEECQTKPLDKALTSYVFGDYCIMASLTKSGSLEDVNAMQKYPDPTTLDEYIAKTKSESKPTSISMRFDDRVNVKELKIDKRFDDLVKELKNTRPTWPS